MKEHKTVLSHLTNEQIREAIFFMIETNKEFEDMNFASLAIKAREIGIYVMSLSNEIYLNEIVEKIQAAGIVKYDPKQMKDVLQYINGYSDDPNIRTNMKAKYFGIITQYLGFEKVANISPDVAIPELYVDYKDGRVYSNLQDIIQSTFRKLEYTKSKEIDKLPFEQRKHALLNDINEKADFKLKSGSKFLDEYLEHFENKLRRATDIIISEKKIFKVNPHTNIFKRNDDYCTNLFEYLLEESVLKRKTCGSSIYHYFKINDYLSPNLTQKIYREFLLKYYSIKISKVFPLNFKMEDNLKDTFKTLEQTFKIEWNRTHQAENETNL